MEWEKLTPAQQQELINILHETGQEIRDQYEGGDRPAGTVCEAGRHAGET
jgi:hypothetical protein